MLSEIGAASALDAYEVPLELRTLAQQSLRNTWFFVPGKGSLGPEGDQVVRSRRGTRPGTPIADLAFGAVIGQAIEATMGEVGHLILTQDAGRIGLPPIIWMDDLAVMLEHKEPQELMRRTEAVLAALDRRMREKGLRVNYKRGKTEVLVNFAGAGAVQQRRRLHFEREDVMEIKVAEEQVQPVHVVSRYRHLGSFQHAANKMHAELGHRIGQASSAWGVGAKKLFGNQALCRTTRVRLMRSLVFSKLLHKCETWPRLKKKIGVQAA